MFGKIMSPVVNLPAVFDGRSGKFFRIKIVRQIAFLLLFFIMSWAYFEITYEVVRELNILHFLYDACNFFKWFIFYCSCLLFLSSFNLFKRPLGFQLFEASHRMVPNSWDKIVKKNYKIGVIFLTWYRSFGNIGKCRPYSLLVPYF
jgi:hypothetical protein